MSEFGQNENIKVDFAHAELVRALVMSSKPKTVLEIGVGGGRTTDAIIDGLKYNRQVYFFTIVDNWYDFGGIKPKEVEDKYSSVANIVTSDEKEFVFSTKTKYDFIMSDADHHNTEKWFEYVFDTLLNDGGTLIYHDINLYDNEFPNLRKILDKTIERGFRYFLFNKNSLPTERCHRGLLVINK